jgi:hypothetical protein
VGELREDGKLDRQTASQITALVQPLLAQV